MFQKIKSDKEKGTPTSQQTTPDTAPSPQLPIFPPSSQLKTPLPDLTHIPNPAVKLVGRESYLDQLNESFSDPAISVVSLIAP